MKRISYLLVFVIIFTSCKKEKELSFSERYEDEVYELINQQYLPYIDTINIKHFRKNIFDRKILLIPDKHLPLEKNIDYLNNLIESNFFTKEEILLNEENEIKYWNHEKLNNTFTVKSIKSKRVDSIRNKIKKLDLIYDFDDPERQKAFNKLYNLKEYYFKSDVGEPLFTISSPFFDKEFKKATFYSTIIEFIMSCEGPNYLYFEKHNGVWKQVAKDEQ